MSKNFFHYEILTATLFNSYKLDGLMYLVRVCFWTITSSNFLWARRKLGRKFDIVVALFVSFNFASDQGE